MVVLCGIATYGRLWLEANKARVDGEKEFEKIYNSPEAQKRLNAYLDRVYGPMYNRHGGYQLSWDRFIAKMAIDNYARGEAKVNYGLNKKGEYVKNINYKEEYFDTVRKVKRFVKKEK